MMHDTSVSFSSIPRTPSSSTAAAFQVPVVENESRTADANPRPRPRCSDRPSCLGQTNLLLTHPRTPVSTPPYTPSALQLVDDPSPLLLQGPWKRPCDARGLALTCRDQ